MAKKTAFLLHYDMLENLKLLGNDVAMEVLTALSLYDQGKDIGILSPHAQFAVNSYLPALNKAKSRWKASVINGGGNLFDDLDEPSLSLDEPSLSLDEPSLSLEAGVLVPVPVPVLAPEFIATLENPRNSPDQKDFPTAAAVAFEEPCERDLFPVGEIAEPQTASETAQIEREGPAVAPMAAPDTIQGDSARRRGESALVPARSRSPPAKSKKTDLSPEQLALFHAAKAVFESDEKAKALIYQDPASTAREMKHLKTLAVRCANIAPEMPAVFLQNILEHFRIMCPKHGWVFTPHTLVTTWIWNKVIDSLPGPENERLRELVRGMFD